MFEFLHGHCQHVIALTMAGIMLPVSAMAAPVTFNTALPVGEDRFVLREQIIFSEASGAGTESDTLTTLTIGGYGVTPKWAVFAAVPILHRSLDTATVSSDTTGFGDASLFTRYEIYKDDSAGATSRVAPLVGVRLPTGRDGETGDGSVDVFGGLVATVATIDYNLGGQILYTANGEGDGVEAGDTLSLDASVQYRVWPQEIESSTPGFLFGVLEANVTWQDDARIGGTTDPDSGGTSFSLSPGLQYITRHWIADVAVTIPVADSFDSDRLEPDYAVLASIRFSF